MTLTGVEQLQLLTGGKTLLVDADTLTVVTTITGSTNELVTADTALNLAGKTVGSNTVHSTNATGTTFTVSSTATAFQILGGPGSDTIETTSFAFSAAERDAIFNGSASIEIIHDTSGFYGDETDNTITGTAAADNMQGGAGTDRLIAAGAADFLGGGSGPDTFVFNLPSEGMDTVSDFISGTDQLEISATGFGGGLTVGGAATLIEAADADSAFKAGANGYFIFDSDGADAGTVYWDANGDSGTDAVAIAQLVGVTSLLVSDFIVA
jgi:Ca2+-binding RTX toxin-like protein